MMNPQGSYTGYHNGHRRNSRVQQQTAPVFTFTSNCNGSVVSVPSISNPNLSQIDIHEEFVNIVTNSDSYRNHRLCSSSNREYHHVPNGTTGNSDSQHDAYYNHHYEESNYHHYGYGGQYRRYASATQLLQVCKLLVLFARNLSLFFSSVVTNE